MLKFLIDECLTLDLVEVAQERGFPESSHVVGMGKAGWKDWELKTFTLDDDWTFVTRNSVAFVAPQAALGRPGNLQMSLFTLDGSASTARMEGQAEVQCELFRAALDEISDTGQLVNEVIEVDLESLEADFLVYIEGEKDREDSRANGVPRDTGRHGVSGSIKHSPVTAARDAWNQSF